ncbi:MAG: C39 family peptidase [Pseudomonadota bacterium]
MTRVLRFGAGRSRERYPLPVSDTLVWQAPSAADAGLTASVDLSSLGTLSAGTLLLPSFTVPGEAQPSYVVSLHGQTGVSWLQAIGEEDLSASGEAVGVSSLVDVFRLDADLTGGMLTLHTNLAEVPRDYLLCISQRPERLSSISRADAIGRARVSIPGLSQRLLPPAIRDHACSPCALLMLLRHLEAPSLPTARDFALRCRDPRSGLFGVWPHNLREAGRHNVVAAVELCSDWSDLHALPGPFVASVRFGSGELPGAPLERTGGHLLVVTGCDAHWVYVNDPAASLPGDVSRRYPRQAFERAWLYERGVAYIVEN